MTGRPPGKNGGRSALRARARAFHKNRLRSVLPRGRACERKTGKGGRDGNMSRGQEKTTQRHSGQGFMFPDEVPR